MLSREEVFALVQSGQMSYDEFDDWCGEMRAAAVEDRDYAASAYGCN